jgi:hypothetical protein
VQGHQLHRVLDVVGLGVAGLQRRVGQEAAEQIALVAASAA